MFIGSFTAYLHSMASIETQEVYKVVRGCEVDVMFFGCRQLLKYNFYVIICRKEREGRKANPTESFAVFALFAVK